MKIKSLTAACLFALTLTAGVAKASDPGTWSIYKAPGGVFEVKLPGEPEIKEETLKSPVGPIYRKFFVSNDTTSLSSYMVATVDLPAFVQREMTANPEAFLDSFAKAIVKDANGRVLSLKKVSMGDNAGVEFSATAFDDAGVVKGRVYAVKGRVYVVMAITPKGEDLSKAINTMLDSFKVNEKANETAKTKIEL